MTSNSVKISELISPNFYDIWKSAKNNEFSEYDETGGRGSSKSSFVSLFIVFNMMNDRNNNEYTHAVVLRQVEKDIRESVFEQIGWAIDKLKVRHKWKRSLSPMKWIYLPNSDKPQEIRFRGCDDPSNVKSIKFAYGYPKYLWFEEADQFKSASDIKNIKLSIARKNDSDSEESETPFVMFKTWNPPEVPNHWINIDSKLNKPYRSKHHSTYLEIPKKWLSAAFIEEAETTKINNIDEYNHTFLGKVTGVKGLCYPMFDMNKHVIELEDFKFYLGERIAKVICGCDGGTINHATTLSPLLLTTSGRIVCMPTFYYDPQNLNHQPLASHTQVKLMEYWLDYWSNKILNQDISNITTIVVDSAAQDLVLAFNTTTKYKAMKVPKKDIILDMKRHQNVLTVPNYFTLINAGYIDPISFNKVSDYDMYIEEILSLVVDEKTGKPIDKKNHTIDGFNYGINVATQI